jgi:DNA polymerase-3 subunit beta
MTTATATTTTTITIAAHEWARIKKAVLPAAAKDESRPVLAGVFVEHMGTYFNFTAADGFRLATHEVLDDRWNDDIKVILHAKDLKKIPARLYPHNPLTFHIDGDSCTVVYYVKGYAGIYEETLDIRVIDGNYPDYRLIFPRDPYFLAAIPVDIIKDAKGDVLRLTPDFIELGNQTKVSNRLEDLDIIRTWDRQDTITYDLGSLAFNPRYLRDALPLSEDGKTLSLYGPSNNGPWVATNHGTRTIIMPMVLGDR